MNIKYLGGRIFALFFIAVFLIGTVEFEALAKSNVWGEWQVADVSDGTQRDNIITSIQNKFNMELWHYSGGYWGNDYVTIVLNTPIIHVKHLTLTASAECAWPMINPQA